MSNSYFISNKISNADNYYLNFFPLSPIINVLEKAGSLSLREISFCLENGNYVRNLCFKDKEQFLEKIRMMKPSKIDIGSVYRSKVRIYLT